MMIATMLPMNLCCGVTGRWLRCALVNPATLRTLATSALAYDAGKPRTFARRVKKVFAPDGEELPTIVTGLEGNRQAQDVASEAAKRSGFRSRRLQVASIGGNSPMTREKSGLKSVPTSADSFDIKLRDGVVDGNITEDESEDEIPQGVNLEDLPRFQKVHGWEKQSSVIRNLKKQLSHQCKHDDTVVLEGKRLIVDAMKNGIYPSVFVFSRCNLLSGIPFDKSKRIAMYQIPYRNIKMWSELKTHPGVMAAVSRSEMETLARTKQRANTLPVTLLMDNVRTPENFGSLLRVAAAVGCRSVISTVGCVDAWQPKVMRAAAGAHLHVPIYTNVRWDEVHNHVPAYSRVLLADLLRSDDVSEADDAGLSEQDLSSRLQDLEERSRYFHIECEEGGDDAETKDEDTGIRNMSEEELKKRIDEEKEKEETQVPDKGKQRQFKDFSYYESDIVADYQSLPLISTPYSDFQPYLPDQEIVIVIGGETEGISSKAKKFALSNLGERVYIPLRSDIDSLNVLSAGSVILFEIQRKFLAFEAQAEKKLG